MLHGTASDTAKIEFIVMNERINVYIFHLQPDCTCESNLHTTFVMVVNSRNTCIWFFGKDVFRLGADIRAMCENDRKHDCNMLVQKT